MSFYVEEAFVKQFSENVRLLSQQQGSKLSQCAILDDIKGEEYFTDQLGATEAVELNDRHGESPIVSTPHHRRRGIVKNFVWGDMIDDEDKVRMLQDPASKYVLNGSYAMGRKKDDVIISAFDTTAYVGKAGTTAKTLPASQKVAVGGTTTNLTYEKLLQARTIIEDNDVDLEHPENELFLLCTPYNIMSLLKQTEVKSIDYNTVKALAEGTVNRYMGFTFKVLSRKRVLADSSGYRRVIAWCKSGMSYGVGKQVEANVAKRADRNFNWYAHLKMVIGSVRLEEEKVVQILCDETK